MASAMKNAVLSVPHADLNAAKSVPHADSIGMRSVPHVASVVTEDVFSDTRTTIPNAPHAVSTAMRNVLQEVSTVEKTVRSGLMPANGLRPRNSSVSTDSFQTPAYAHVAKRMNSYRPDL